MSYYGTNNLWPTHGYNNHRLRICKEIKTTTIAPCGVHEDLVSMTVQFNDASRIKRGHLVILSQQFKSLQTNPLKFKPQPFSHILDKEDKPITTNSFKVHLHGISVH